MASGYERAVGQAEDIADTILRHSKVYLPHIARLCLVATFIEDGIRMWFQWTEQADYINITWGCGAFLANMFVIINLIGQLGACTTILVRKFVPASVGVLFGIILLQTFVYTVLWDMRFFLRNLALSGGLLLLFAEATGEVKTMFAGLPSTGINTTQNYIQLAGRLLLLELVIGSVLMVGVAVGYRTKLSALLLVLWLAILNFLINDWWNVPTNRIMRDFLKYDFFQTLSVIGGLLFVVALGPGGVSWDEHKKKW